VIGVDPGLSGALVVLNSQGELEECNDMPTIGALHGKGKTVDLRKLAEILDIPSTDVLVLVEAVNSMPNQGISSAFKFGRVSMAPEAISIALGFNVRLVTPQAWKKHFSLIKRDKSASRARAMQEFPEKDHLFGRVKDDGRADAALIALYGYQVFVRGPL
jgi:crossover junction endodeoxyribonuclease RuvC